MLACVCAGPLVEAGMLVMLNLQRTRAFRQQGLGATCTRARKRQRGYGQDAQRSCLECIQLVEFSKMLQDDARQLALKKKQKCCKSLLKSERLQ